MENYVQNGEQLSLTAPTGGVVSGSGYLIGSLFVVAATTAAETESFVGVTCGVFTLPKVSAQAWTEGQKIYWDAANARCTTVATDGSLIGVAKAVAANPSSSGQVRLNGGAAALAEGPQAAIANLTDNSGGTANSTIEAVAAVTGVDGTASNAASLTETNARLVSIANNFADLAAKMNTLLAELRAGGVIAP